MVDAKAMRVLPVPDVAAPPMVFSWRGAVRGATMMAGLLPAVFAFGIGFGLVAKAAGMDLGIAAAMSGLTFAGASQYVAADLWHQPFPWFALAVAVIGVNMRHFIYGATLHPWLKDIPAMKRYAVVILLTDPNWIAARNAFENGERDAAILVGSGVMLWAGWLAGTLAGVALGDLLGDTRAWGIDVLLPAFFLGSLAGMHRQHRDILPWVISFSVACLSQDLLPPGGYIVAGALAGGLFGAVMDARD